MDFLNHILEITEQENKDINMEIFLNGKNRDNLLEKKIASDIWDLIYSYSQMIQVLKLEEMKDHFNELEESF
jgi:polyhydroxyalkanoate synthesis regulator phasin